MKKSYENKIDYRETPDEKEPDVEEEEKARNTCIDLIESKYLFIQKETAHAIFLQVYRDLFSFVKKNDDRQQF